MYSLSTFNTYIVCTMRRASCNSYVYTPTQHVIKARLYCISINRHQYVIINLLTQHTGINYYFFYCTVITFAVRL
jgi:hypothetical protein